MMCSIYKPMTYLDKRFGKYGVAQYIKFISYKYIENIVSFYDFIREKLVRMKEDGDTTEISDIESGDESS